MRWRWLGLCLVVAMPVGAQSAPPLPVPERSPSVDGGAPPSAASEQWEKELRAADDYRMPRLGLQLVGGSLAMAVSVGVPLWLLVEQVNAGGGEGLAILGVYVLPAGAVFFLPMALWLFGRSTEGKGSFGRTLLGCLLGSSVSLTAWLVVLSSRGPLAVGWASLLAPVVGGMLFYELSSRTNLAELGERLAVAPLALAPLARLPAAGGVAVVGRL